MEAIKNYFGSLQKYFKTNEILSFSQTSDSLKIVSSINPSKLIQLLQENSGAFESNFKNALLKIFPNQSSNINYTSNSVIGSFKRYTYFDMIPQELIVEIATYLKTCQGIIRLNSILDVPVENLTNRVIQNLMPELYKWIVS